MHAKAMVIDDTVFAGSYNFSHSGEENAENLLRFDSVALADTFVQYINTLVARYGAP
jgi:phosphatidylserine/phosphatidylglycerophosphate/cardiolipin synthase-like enzyme